MMGLFIGLLMIQKIIDMTESIEYLMENFILEKVEKHHGQTVGMMKAGKLQMKKFIDFYMKISGE